MGAFITGLLGLISSFYGIKDIIRFFGQGGFGELMLGLLLVFIGLVCLAVAAESQKK